MNGVELKGFKALSGILDDSKKTTTILNDNNLMHVSLDKLHASLYQPRRHFDEQSLKELAASIIKQGILQPIVVRKATNGYEIIAGERRWRAAAIAGLKEVPVLLRNISDKDALAIALIENIQRENLNPIDEALGIKRLSDECNLTHEEIAKLIGKSRSAVTNLLRLLNLEEEVKNMLSNREIDSGHAKALLALRGSQQIDVAKSIKENRAKPTVRQIEHIVRQRKKNNRAPANEVTSTNNWENILSNKLHSKVIVRDSGYCQKMVTIVFKNENELEQFVNNISLKIDQTT